MRKSKKGARYSNAVFFVPVVIVLLLVAFALLSGATVTTGVLVITAQSSGNPKAPIHVKAVVGGFTGTTPFNVTLSQGDYVVAFGQLSWYTIPSSNPVTVNKGQTQYAVGVYRPISKTIAITDTGFNSTTVVALHGVTPVTWINQGQSALILRVQGLDPISLQPGQTSTQVFPGTGTFLFSCSSFSSIGSLESV